MAVSYRLSTHDQLDEASERYSHPYGLRCTMMPVISLGYRMPITVGGRRVMKTVELRGRTPLRRRMLGHSSSAFSTRLNRRMTSDCGVPEMSKRNGRCARSIFRAGRSSSCFTRLQLYTRHASNTGSFPTGLNDG